MQIACSAVERAHAKKTPVGNNITSYIYINLPSIPRLHLQNSNSFQPETRPDIMMTEE